jgi:EAL domain-containing protein (putative c-di-GMP-specific phosphodiesterase class I)
LRRLEVDLLQGFLYALPQPAEQLEALLRLGLPQAAMAQA